MEADGDVQLEQCRTCTRSFRLDVLKKHSPICLKNSKKKRKIFDSGKQRAEGSDIPINKVLKPGEIPKTDPKLAIAEAKTKQWRQKHESLVEAFRTARNYAKAKSQGGPLPPPAPAVIDSSLVQCPYCQRRFNEESSKRHIPFCKDQQAKILPKNNVSTSKKSLYKAPLPKPKQEPPRTNLIVSNGPIRQRLSPQSSQPGFPRSEVSVANVTKSNVPARNNATRTQPSPSLASSNQPRGSIGGTRPTKNLASVPKGPAKKTAVSTSNMAGFCHECGNTFALSSARFCSECGVRRLTL